ncbi:hypothetical protein JOL79_03000 [Microbispora sp. RL4-1S]|uniref:Uncharacterized protein n=1 Tax=Microbispora oryzae TaxID=2806554 RepID=A0A940WC40_9ACTN|nr:hypothetical protein [Microbispora oryzae]MBP2702769.1 hypothetical protein [Microbispora oryzae]
MRLHRIESRTFGEGVPFLPESASPLLRSYVDDLTALYGMTAKAGFLRTARRHSYADIAGGMLRELEPLPGPVGLLAVATAVPDSDLLQSPTSFLADAVPGNPLPLGVVDQGVVAPFTALRLIQRFAADGSYGTALLMIMDQRTLPYEPEMPSQARPEADAAVALVLSDEGAAGGLAVRHRVGVSPDEAAAVLAEELAAGRAGDDVTVVAGRGVLGLLPAGLAEVREAAPGLPCTGVWAALADGMPRWRSAGRRVVVCDYDRTLRYLSTCVIDVEAVDA